METATVPDWNEVWRQGWQRKNDAGHRRGDWNRRARSFARNCNRSGYAGNFLNRIELDPTLSVLDIGRCSDYLCVFNLLNLRWMTGQLSGREELRWRDYQRNHLIPMPQAGR